MVMIVRYQCLSICICVSKAFYIRNSKNHTNVHYAKLVSLRIEIYSNPQLQWRVDMLSNKMNMCSTYLQKIYRETFGISCVADVNACKINYSKDILSKTNMSIIEVSTGSMLFCVILHLK
jgi:AraC-like DNA-binding protein